MLLPISSITTTGPVSQAYNNYLVAATGGNLLLTLPLITDDGTIFRFKRTDNVAIRTVTINAIGGQLINGLNNILLSTSSLEFQSYQLGWYTFNPYNRIIIGATVTPVTIFFNSNGNGLSNNNYMGPGGPSNNFNIAASQIGRTGTISNLWMLGVTGGGVSDATGTVYINGVATALSASWPLSTARFGSNTTTTLNVLPFDLISVRVTSAGTISRGSASVLFNPT